MSVAHEAARRLVSRYGSRAPALLAEAAVAGSCAGRNVFEPVGPSIPELGAELLWLARHEFAETAEDALRRRLPRLLTDRVAAADLAEAERMINLAKALRDQQDGAHQRDVR